MDNAIAEGSRSRRKVIPVNPVIDAICRIGRKFIWEYAMLPALPSGENVIRRYSKEVHNTGIPKTVHHFGYFRTNFLFTITINAKTKEIERVIIRAGRTGSTFNR